MSAIKLSTPSSGSISLSPADTASNLTITVPAVTGTMAIQGAAFGAYANANTSIPTSNVWTKIAFQVEEFDTANCFDNTTNFRFTPNVAGYYQINACVQINGGTGVTQFATAIYKNGASFKRSIKGDSNALFGLPVTSLIYLNGSTDYIEIYCLCAFTGGSVASNANQEVTYFNGCLVRAA